MNNIINALLGILFAIPTPAIATTTPVIVDIKPVATTTPVIIPDVLNRIVKCESNGNPLARNKYSSAKGLFQFIDGTWKYYGTKLWGDKWIEKDVFNPDHQWELALYVYKVNGVKDWQADPKSYNCWKSASGG